VSCSTNGRSWPAQGLGVEVVRVSLAAARAAAQLDYRGDVAGGTRWYWYTLRGLRGQSAGLRTRSGS
jgi:hypothetical protein